MPLADVGAPQQQPVVKHGDHNPGDEAVGEGPDGASDGADEGGCKADVEGGQYLRENHTPAEERCHHAEKRKSTGLSWQRRQTMPVDFRFSALIDNRWQQLRQVHGSLGAHASLVRHSCNVGMPIRILTRIFTTKSNNRLISHKKFCG